MKLTFFDLVSVTVLFIAMACEELRAEPHCAPCPYSCAHLGLGNKDCSFLSESRGLCCVDLSSKGLRLAREQERVLGTQPVYNPPVYNPPVQERCPAGFQPSEIKCSPQERKRGCKDIRLPSGLGCVSR